MSGEFSAQNITNMLWAFARMERKPGELLLKLLERRAGAISEDFSAQEVEDMQWAYATMGSKPGERMLLLLEGRAEETSMNTASQVRRWGFDSEKREVKREAPLEQIDREASPIDLEIESVRESEEETQEHRHTCNTQLFLAGSPVSHIGVSPIGVSGPVTATGTTATSTASAKDSTFLKPEDIPNCSAISCISPVTSADSPTLCRNSPGTCEKSLSTQKGHNEDQKNPNGESKGGEERKQLEQFIAETGGRAPAPAPAPATVCSEGGERSEQLKRPKLQV